jgi:hypothetical protein
MDSVRTVRLMQLILRPLGSSTAAPVTKPSIKMLTMVPPYILVGQDCFLSFVFFKDRLSVRHTAFCANHRRFAPVRLGFDVLVYFRPAMQCTGGSLTQAFLLGVRHAVVDG